MQERYDLTGKKFGMLTVIGLDHIHPTQNRYMWKCDCSCGGTRVVPSYFLNKGKNLSCGCINYPNIHGLSRTREYNTWKGIKNRCYNTNDSHYPSYGGRGIEMCDRWLESPETFISDMGLCPDGYSIEREDVNGNYTPDNCVWASNIVQSRNTRRTVRVTYKGEEMVSTDFADKIGLPRSSVNKYLKLGMSPDEIARQPRKPLQRPYRGGYVIYDLHNNSMMLRGRLEDIMAEGIGHSVSALSRAARKRYLLEDRYLIRFKDDTTPWWKFDFRISDTDSPSTIVLHPIDEGMVYLFDNLRDAVNVLKDIMFNKYVINVK